MTDEAAKPGTLRQIWGAIDGKKTHITAAIGMIVVAWVHFSGQPIPGVKVDDSQWLTTEWYLLGVMCGRDAVKKVQNAMGGVDFDKLIAAAQVILAASRNGGDK